MLTKIRNQWQHFNSNNKLILSCEILINNQDANTLPNPDAFEKERLLKAGRAFSTEFPGFNVSLITRVCELEIKILALEVYTDRLDMLDALKNAFIRILDKIRENPSYQVRLNAFGTFTTRTEEQQFQFLNRDTLVMYKVTETKPVELWQRIFCRSVRTYIFILVVLALVIWRGYAAWQAGRLPPPDKLLDKTFQTETGV